MRFAWIWMVILLSACTGIESSSFLKTANIEEPETTASIPQAAPDITSSLTGNSVPEDDVTLGKRHYLAQNYGLAEQYFRTAVEKTPRDGEAWLGLAAAYDRLKRFELSDRAYQQAQAILGPTTDVLNNHGYSYMLRGQFKQARQKLVEAQSKDPQNQHVKNNIELLEAAARMGKGIN